MNLSDFQPNSKIPAFAEAMRYLREHPGTTLTIDPGTYLLTSQQARDAQQSVMTGKWGKNPQRAMFNPSYSYTRGISLSGQKGSRILAYGVTLMIDGFMEPVSITDCEDIELCGLTIDHVRKPYSKGTVEYVSPPDDQGFCTCIVKLDPSCPIHPKTPVDLRRMFYHKTQNRVIRTKVTQSRYIDPFCLRLQIRYHPDIHPGAEYYTLHTFHSRPAILIERAKNIQLRDITIHSQPGMGIVGNRSENILLSGLRVIPSAGHHWATNTDATHFTSITGTLRYENCQFESQGDDSANVHSYYQAIISREAPCICTIQEKTPDGTHAQTLDYPDSDDLLELTDLETLQVIDRFRVIHTYPQPDTWCCRVVLDHPLPAQTEHLALADVTRLPRLEIVGCTAKKHFARGLMIKTRDVLIEGNTLQDIPKAGIQLSAESRWFEGVSPANVTIRHNRILNCGCGIMIRSDCSRPESQSIHSVCIENNLIDCPNADYGIYARNTDRLHLSNNQIRVKGSKITCIDCSRVTGQSDDIEHL